MTGPKRACFQTHRLRMDGGVSPSRLVWMGIFCRNLFSQKQTGTKKRCFPYLVPDRYLCKYNIPPSVTVCINKSLTKESTTDLRSCGKYVRTDILLRFVLLVTFYFWLLHWTISIEWMLWCFIDTWQRQAIELPLSGFQNWKFWEHIYTSDDQRTRTFV